MTVRPDLDADFEIVVAATAAPAIYLPTHDDDIEGGKNWR